MNQDNTYAPIIIILIAALLIGGFLYTFLAVDDEADYEAVPAPEQPQEPADEAVAGVPNGFELYTNDAADVQFIYPVGARAGYEAGRAEVMYLGPNNTPDSEISDGFTFYVESITVQPEDSLASVADEQFEAMTKNRASMQPPTEISVNGEQAYEFKVESELGPVITYVVMEGSSETVLLVAYSVLGDEDGKYQTMVNEMLKTIEMK